RRRGGHRLRRRLRPGRRPRPDAPLRPQRRPGRPRLPGDRRRPVHLHEPEHRGGRTLIADCRLQIADCPGKSAIRNLQSAIRRLTVADMTPRQIVQELDRSIVGQDAAKRAVAIAIRNRWRRQHLPPELRKDVTPKNIIMIGPTGVGKTEIARRLAQLVGAPFLKVEATKYTEVGYHGRDVESMVRDLTEIAIGMVRQEQRGLVETQAKEKVTERLLDLLLPSSGTWDPEQPDENERRQRTCDKMKARLEAGDLEDRMVELTVEQKAVPIQVFSNLGMEQMDVDFQNMFERLIPKQSHQRQVPLREARRILIEMETENLIDRAVVTEKAVDLVENQGIIFLDGFDRVGAPASSHGPDISRQGVQRDLLPVVEGTTVNTRQGPVRTDHILFIAAGAFHLSKPSDLMPELQGRFPIRVELTD